MFVVSALKSSLLGLLTARDAAGSGQISSTKMKKHRKMSSLVSASEGRQGGERFDHEVRSQALHCQTCSSRMNPHAHTPLIWTLWHDEELSALTVLLFQRTKSPQKGIARC